MAGILMSPTAGRTLLCHLGTAPSAAAAAAARAAGREFFHPRMTRGGFMLFDDYGFPKYEQTIRTAVNQFFRMRPESVVVLPTGQCFVCKL